MSYIFKFSLAVSTTNVKIQVFPSHRTPLLVNTLSYVMSNSCVEVCKHKDRHGCYTWRVSSCNAHAYHEY